MTRARSERTTRLRSAHPASNPLTWRHQARTRPEVQAVPGGGQRQFTRQGPTSRRRIPARTPLSTRRCIARCTTTAESFCPIAGDAEVSDVTERYEPRSRGWPNGRPRPNRTGNGSTPPQIQFRPCRVTGDPSVLAQGDQPGRPAENNPQPRGATPTARRLVRGQECGANEQAAPGPTRAS